MIIFNVFLKNRNFISKIWRSKITVYAALIYPFTHSVICKQVYKWPPSWENLLYVNVKTKTWRVSERYIMAIHIPKSENRAIHILSFSEGAYHIPGGAEKGSYLARTSELGHNIVIYRELSTLPVTHPLQSLNQPVFLAEAIWNFIRTPRQRNCIESLRSCYAARSPTRQ